MKYDTIGIGFGPSNIALAIALEERGSRGRRDGHIFFDSRPEPDWHPGMMFEDATMQISFLKDLITMVNPRSRYTFLNFIHVRGRIHEFINLRTFHPRRTEFEEYIKWCAQELAEFAIFNRQVQSVRLTRPNQPKVSDLTVVVDQPGGEEKHEFRTRSLILADGGLPTWPLSKPQKEYSTVFHSSQTLPRLTKLDLAPNGHHTFHIVGSGQSAADTFAYLAGNYRNATIYMSHRSYAMRPEDDSHFINELFMPNSVDQIFEMSTEWRRKLIRDYWHVTHNGVTIDLIPKLYEMVYYDKVNGRNRFHFKRFSEIKDARETDRGAVATMCSIHTGEHFEIVADATILATGYTRPCPHPLLADLSDHLEIEPEGAHYRTHRDYCASSPECTGFQVFLQGYAENTHGFSEALLSLMPERASRIADGIMRSSDVMAVDQHAGAA